MNRTILAALSLLVVSSIPGIAHAIEGWDPRKSGEGGPTCAFLQDCGLGPVPTCCCISLSGNHLCGSLTDMFCARNTGGPDCSTFCHTSDSNVVCMDPPKPWPDCDGCKEYPPL